jgi:hypothetical protein
LRSPVDATRWDLIRWVIHETNAANSIAPIALVAKPEIELSNAASMITWQAPIRRTTIGSPSTTSSCSGCHPAWAPACAGC